MGKAELAQGNGRVMSGRIRSSMRLALEGEGYEVRDAASAEEGLELFAEAPTDVALIDLMLPGMDGFECCRPAPPQRRTHHHRDGSGRHPRRGGRARGRGGRLRHQTLRGQGTCRAYPRPPTP